MAFTMRSLPTSLCLSHKPLYLGLHRSPSSTLPAFHSNFGAPLRPSIHCNAQEESETMVQDEKHHKEVTTNPSWSTPDSPAPVPPASHSPDRYAGWPPVDTDSEGSWKAGLLQVGAGFVLAVGFSFAAYSAYSRYGGKRQLDMAPMQQQQVSTTSESESLDTSSNKDTSGEPLERDSIQDLHKEGELLDSDIEETVPASETESGLGQVSISSKEGPVLSSDADKGVPSNAASDDLYQEQNPNKSPSSDKADIMLSSRDIETEAERPFAAAEPTAKAPEKPGLSSQNPVSSPSFEVGAVSRVPAPASVEQDPNLEKGFVSGELTNFKKGLGISPSTVIDSQAGGEEQDQLEDVNIGEGVLTTGHWQQVLNDPATSSKPEVDMNVLDDLQLDLNEDANSGVDTPADESKDDTEGWSNKVDRPFSGADLWQSTSLYIPAPLSAISALQSRPGKVVVPAVVDQMQQHALEALQTLKVMDPEIEASDICTRREYARWLIASSCRLARTTAHKVLPAMYIENVTQLAFDDVSAEDQDFAFIQGLAEAGLVWSNLSTNDVKKIGKDSQVFFEPDRPLSRQDLVSWKLALDRHELTGVDKEALQKVSGFVDVDQIHKDAWPALMADLTAEGPSIVASAFGFTRRFQPEKPTTKGQAAIALASGEAAESVSGELARLEAEAMAEKAVAADIAMEIRAQSNINDHFHEELRAEKEKRVQAEKIIEEVKAELQQARAERDEERYSVLKDRATLDSEKELLNELRQQVDEQLQMFSNLRVEVAAEKERLEKLRVEREEELKSISSYKLELEVERRAVILVRSWAEDEAKQAQAQGQILEEARKHWENQGLEVDTDLDTDYNPGQIKDIKMELENLLQQVPQQDAIGEDFKSQVNDAIIRSWQATTGVFSGLFHKVAMFLQELGRKTHQLQHNAMSSAGEGAQHFKEALGKSTQDMQAAVGERVQDVQAAMGEKAHNVQATVAAASTSVVEGSKRLADNCKGEAEKLAQRFKH